jgi:hypothetical protein
VNHGEFITDVWVPPVIGPGFIQAETRKQYDEMRREILRRSKPRSQAESRGTATGAPFSEPGRAID